MPEVYKQELKTRGDSDFGYENEVARYRVSVVRQRLGVEIVFRVINPVRADNRRTWIAATTQIAGLVTKMA